MQPEKTKSKFFIAMKKVTFIMTAALFVLTASAQPTAKEWNKEVVGWNLGNQL